MLTKYAVIVAGGSGTRMNASVAKQFMDLAGMPIILHTLLKFKDIADHIILVLPKDQFETWEHIRAKFNPDIRITLAEGGATRTDSVKSGLSQIYEQEALVAIHDAVRPFVSEIIIENSYRSAIEHGSGVVAVPVKDSVRRVVEEKSVALDRSEYYLVQTPQTFQYSALIYAYEKAAGVYTDDASVFEANGNKVYLVPGAYENIKITTPEDIYLGEAIYQYQNKGRV